MCFGPIFLIKDIVDNISCELTRPQYTIPENTLILKHGMTIIWNKTITTNQ